MKPSFIYFDLDDTLLDHRHAERLALADVCRDYEATFGRFELARVQETYHRFNTDLWERYGRGDLSKADLKRLRFERLLEALAANDAAPEALSDHYMACYARHWAYVEGAREAFLAVADRYRVGILTNGFSEVQQAKLERFPELLERIDVLVVSEEVGYMKPDARIFAHAAEAAGAAPGEILYVGDSYGSDVRGALGAGWRAAWFRGDPGRVEGEPDAFCFDRWEELPGRLD